MTPIMATKLLPPRISSELIERPRLLELFSQRREVKLIVLNAPAGYGKTVSILQYVNTLGSPFVWYQLDPYDNDPAVFIQYLISGIASHFPGFGTETLPLLLQSNITSSLRFIVVSLINELARLANQDCVLVLDDFHVITSPAIHQFIQELLDHLPAGIRLIITSRTALPWSLSRFQVTGEILMLNIDTLRFTAMEANEFLSQRQLSPPRQWLDSLMSKTGGWPAAFKLLTAPAFQNSKPLPSSGTEFIFNYLADEVLNRQSEEIRDFLLSTAVLETITPESCNLLLNRSDSQSILDHLEKQQLFLTPLAGQHKVYRYHQLFRDFLLDRLGPKKNSIAAMAGKIALQNGDWDHAIEYLTAAGGASHNLIPLLEKAGRQAFREGRWQTVERWLETLTREQISSNEWLALFQAKIDVYRGKLDEAEIWANKSLSGFTDGFTDGFGVRQDPVGVAECQFLRAKILNRNGNYQDSLVLLAESYPVLQKEEPSLRFELPLEKALVFIRMGRLRQAEELLLKGLQVTEKPGDFWIAAHFLEGLGNTYYMLGETFKALEYYQKAARLSPQGILPGYCADFTGFLHQELGELGQALEYLQNCITLKESLGMNGALLPAYYQLSSIYTDIGELEKAEAIYQKAIQLITEIGGERFFLILLKVNLGRIRCMQGRLVEAQVMMAQILAESKAESGVALLMCRLFYGLAFLMSGNFAEAEEVLLESIEPEIEFAQALTYCYFLLTSIKFATGDLPGAAEYSRKLLNFAASKNFEQMFVFMFDNAQPILQFGLENGIEIPFIQRVLVLLGERCFSLLTDLASHPEAPVRARVIFPLSQINTVSANQLLQVLANSPDPKIRRAVNQCVTLNGEAGFSVTENHGSHVLSRKQMEKIPVGACEFDFGSLPFLKIEMLGSARIILKDTDITGIKWRFTKSRDLLLYLAHHDRPVGINRILEDLWPEVPLEKGMNLFYGALHWLRQVIQKTSHPEPVTYTAKICQLIPDIYTTDRRRFISLINEGSTDNHFTMENSALLEETAALYQGEYLSQLDYPWVITEREHLKRLYLETMVRLARFYLQNRDYLKVVRVLEPLAGENPLREELFGLLMSAYSGLGDPLAVIRQYQQLQSNLDKELGVRPAPEITKLYYQLCSSNESSRERLKQV